MVQDIEEHGETVTVRFDSAIGGATASWKSYGRGGPPLLGARYSVEISLDEEPEGFSLGIADERQNRIEQAGPAWRVTGQVDGVDDDGVIYMRIGSAPDNSTLVMLEPGSEPVQEGDWIVVTTTRISLYDTGYIKHPR